MAATRYREGQGEVEGTHEGRVLAEFDDICVELKRLKEAWVVAVADEECALIAPGHRSVGRYSDYLEQKEGERESDVQLPKSERLAAEIEALQARQQDLLDMLTRLRTYASKARLRSYASTPGGCAPMQAPQAAASGWEKERESERERERERARAIRSGCRRLQAAAAGGCKQLLAAA